MTLAWHYTVGLKLPLIRESGVLRPTDAGIGPDERPVLWFSTAPYWEPTSAKMRVRTPQERLTSIDGLPFRRLSMQENAEMGERLYRFGLPASALIRWPEIASEPVFAHRCAILLCESDACRGPSRRSGMALLKKFRSRG
jgi:hypothetical protein